MTKANVFALTRRLEGEDKTRLQDAFETSSRRLYQDQCLVGNV